MATALKPLSGGKGAAGDGGQADEPQPMRLPQAPPAMAAGGPMMIGPGGQNTMGQRTAQQDLAQRGFSMQPQLASYYGGLGATRSPVPTMMPGQATGIPAMPGTTLNRPSQLQMALMTGSMSPYDMYANMPPTAAASGARDHGPGYVSQLTDMMMVNPWMFDPTQKSNQFSNYNNAALPWPPTLQQGRRAGQRRDRPADPELSAMAGPEPRRHVDQRDARAARAAAAQFRPVGDEQRHAQLDGAASLAGRRPASR